MTKFNRVDKMKWCLAPTLALSDRYKKRATSLKDRGRRVIRLNKIYLLFSVGFYGILSLMPYVPFHGISKRIFILFIMLWAVSRINEIFMAFVKDVFDKLDPTKRQKNGLEYFERIRMALRSFIELTIQYAILYFLLDTYTLRSGTLISMFNQHFTSPFAALYFSLMTIASIGYGDYYPVHPIARGLIMYEVITGFLLLAVSFTVYVGLDLDEKEAP